MSNSHDQLERDLRAALRSVDHAPVSGDAWQQNQRRLAASPSRLRLPLLLAAAAVVLVVLLVGGLLAVVTDGSDSGTPASGDGSSDSSSSADSSSDDVFADENLLGPIMEVERLTVGGEQAVHEAALSDTSGKGPSLCDRVVTVSSESGGCTSREPDADEPTVAIDWLTGSMGNGNRRGVLAGVDKRVMKVQVWMDNGDIVLADLKPTGWESSKLFGLTVPADGPRPQRLVAYSDALGTVLQAVDLVEQFGDEWLPLRDDCGRTGAAAPVPGLDATVSGEPGSVSLAMELPGSSARTVCLPMTTAASGATAGPNDVILVVGPEVGGMELRTERHFEATYTSPVPVPGTIWSVVTVHESKGFEAADQLVLLDPKLNPLTSVEVGSLS